MKRSAEVSKQRGEVAVERTVRGSELYRRKLNTLVSLCTVEARLAAFRRPQTFVHVRMSVMSVWDVAGMCHRLVV
jgi:hypothetical protein